MPERTATSARAIHLVQTQSLRLAVSGTDTNVGKTLVSCALATALRTAGLRVAAMKPVETGVSGPSRGTDAARLRRAAGGLHPPEDVCPVTYAEPLAPLVAADRARRAVDLAVLDAARLRLEAISEAFLVEGAGGLLVPFARVLGGGILDLATLAVRWHLDLVIVAANRLGVLNHVLLTVREAERRGVPVRAVVLNTVSAAAPDVSEATNLGVLRDLLPTVPVVPFPYVAPADADDPLVLARVGASLAAALAAR